MDHLGNGAHSVAGGFSSPTSQHASDPKCQKLRNCVNRIRAGIDGSVDGDFKLRVHFQTGVRQDLDGFQVQLPLCIQCPKHHAVDSCKGKSPCLPPHDGYIQRVIVEVSGPAAQQCMNSQPWPMLQDIGEHFRRRGEAAEFQGLAGFDPVSPVLCCQPSTYAAGGNDLQGRVPFGNCLHRYFTAPADKPPIRRFSIRANRMMTGTIATIDTPKTYCQAVAYWPTNLVNATLNG